MSENNQSLEQYVTKIRNEVILSHSQTQQISLNAFDKMVQQLQQMIQLIKTKEDEIKRLQALCIKNKIDINPIQKSPPKDNKIAPAKP